MENTLFYGDEAKAALLARKTVGEGVPRVHFTISTYGINKEIAEAREKGHPLFLEDVAEFSQVILDIVERELKVGGFKCVAWMKACPCGKGYGICRCSNREVLKYKARIHNSLKTLFTMVDANEKTSAIALDKIYYREFAGDVSGSERVRCNNWSEVCNLARRLWEGWRETDDYILFEKGYVRLDAWTAVSVSALTE